MKAGDASRYTISDNADWWRVWLNKNHIVFKFCAARGFTRPKR